MNRRGEVHLAHVLPEPAASLLSSLARKLISLLVCPEETYP